VSNVLTVRSNSDAIRANVFTQLCMRASLMLLYGPVVREIWKADGSATPALLSSEVGLVTKCLKTAMGTSMI
jgi:hypothetical protein